MLETLANFLSSESFMPHGHCYQWKPTLLWLQVGANLAIGVSYVTIASGLAILVKRLENPPFEKAYWAFSAFILTCGITHFSDIWVIWDPQYWLDGGFRAICAVASVATAAMIPSLVPKAEALGRSVNTVERQGVEIEKAFRDLARVHEKTKELEERKTEFFANVSHELRTPLTLILGRTDQLAESDTLDEESRAAVSTVADNARVLLKHVNDLLDVASMDAGQMQLEASRFDLAKRVRRTCAHFDGLAESDGISFSVQTPDSLMALGDPAKVESILLNLLSNAFKFTPDGGSVDCLLEVDEDRPGLARLRICDSGPGVPEEHRDAIFERFRQADSESARRFGGTGLGLVVTKDFAELHGGSVELTEGPLGGACFTVELPVVQIDQDDPQPEETDSTSRGTYQSGKFVSVVTQRVRDNRHTPMPDIHDGLTIEQARAMLSPTDDEQADVEQRSASVLVVEDTEDMNDYICEILSEDVDVRSAFRARRALEMANEHPPDLIVTDLIMPDMSGRELIAQLQLHEKLRDIPVLVVTAKADGETRTKLLREGAADFVEKPFMAEELRSRVRNLVDIKQTRDVLQEELETKRRNIRDLASELGLRRAELETALETVETARDQAEQASQLKSRFLGLISHELRTPLTAFRLETDLLQRTADNLTDRQKHILDRMGSAVRRLTDMIESLLQRAAIESGRLEVKPEPFDLEDLAHATIPELRPYAEKKGLEIEVLSTADLAPLESDPRLVRLILVNLVGNAVKFSDSGTISIMLDQAEGRHRIAVRDEGPGIEPEMQVRIFDAFEKSESSSDKQIPGAGLGLALVRDMSMGLGGEVEVDSTPGEGSTFTVTLPSRLEDNPTLNPQNKEEP